MTWIKTVPLSEANEDLLGALESQRALYPQEYASPVFRADDEMAGIVASHSLIHDALYHALSTDVVFGVFLTVRLIRTPNECRSRKGKRHRTTVAVFHREACECGAIMS